MTCDQRGASFATVSFHSLLTMAASKLSLAITSTGHPVQCGCCSHQVAMEQQRRCDAEAPSIFACASGQKAPATPVAPPKCRKIVSPSLNMDRNSWGSLRGRGL